MTDPCLNKPLSPRLQRKAFCCVVINLKIRPEGENIVAEGCLKSERNARLKLKPDRKVDKSSLL